MQSEMLNNVGLQQPKTVSKRDATVEKMKTAFILGVSEGQDKKEAFYNAIKAASEHNNMQKDTFYNSQDIRYEKATVGKSSITPEDISKWIDVITKIGPIIVSVYDWIESKLPHEKNNKEVLND